VPQVGGSQPQTWRRETTLGLSDCTKFHHSGCPHGHGPCGRFEKPKTWRPIKRRLERPALAVTSRECLPTSFDEEFLPPLLTPAERHLGQANR